MMNMPPETWCPRHLQKGPCFEVAFMDVKECHDMQLQWRTFKLFGITYLVGNIKFKLLFHGPLAE